MLIGRAEYYLPAPSRSFPVKLGWSFVGLLNQTGDEYLAETHAIMVHRERLQFRSGGRDHVPSTGSWSMLPS